MNPIRAGEKGNPRSIGDRDAGVRRGQGAAAFDGDRGGEIDLGTSGRVIGPPSLPSVAPNDAPDDRPPLRHHPVIGYQYRPGMRVTRTRPDGEIYQFNVNAAGICSDREYSFAKPADVFRILVFGDSQAEGWLQPNERRFSTLIERRNPWIEVINFSLVATGTDQQLLTYEEIGRNYEHDLVLLLPYLDNIRKNLLGSLPFRTPGAEGVALTLKPRFVLTTHADGTEALELHNVPIPDAGQEPDSDNMRNRARESTPAGRIAHGSRRPRNRVSAVRLAKKYLFPLFSLVGFDPFPLLGRLGYDLLPEYETPDTEEWRLMAALIRRFARATEPKPFVIAPIVLSTYMRFSVGRNYWERFRSLDDGQRVHVIDLLPHFLRRGRRAVECYMEPMDNHLSDLGQSVLADAVEAELRCRGLIPARDRGPRAAD